LHPITVCRIFEDVGKEPTERERDMSRLFGVTFRVREGDMPSLITSDSSDPLDWDNRVAEFGDVFVAREFAEECYDTLTEMSAYKGDWQSLMVDVVEFEGCQECGAYVFRLPEPDSDYFHVGANCAHGQNLAHVEVAV
jgi:hypothetical protein